MSSDHQVQEWFAGALVVAGILALLVLDPRANERPFLGLGPLLAGLIWMFVAGSRPLRIAAGLWLASLVTLLVAMFGVPPLGGAHVDGPWPVSASNILFVVIYILAIMALWQTMRTFRRPRVALVLTSWMVLTGFMAISSGGGVAVCLHSPELPPEEVVCRGHDFPWEEVWLVGTLAIIAVGVVSRKRDIVSLPVER